MYLQSSPDWKFLPMHTEGCAALSVLWYVSKRGKLPSSVAGVENDILHMIFAEMHYDEKAAINGDCDVQSYDGVAEWYGIKVLSPCKIVDAGYKPGSGEELIGEWKGDSGRHFTACLTGGKVTYDPAGYWRGFPHARLVSYRVIHWDK
jgi:hypothetical protein